jgi:hypothetical protein
MTISERILQTITDSGPLDDDEIAQRLHVVRQQVNQAARRLESSGRLRRYEGSKGKIVNEILDGGNGAVRSVPQESPLDSLVTEPTTGRPAARDAATQLLLVTCVKTKADTPTAAKDLYVSPLFKRQRAYAEKLGVPWFILSAEHGLVAPDEWLAPYERYLPETPRAYRRAWGSFVVARLSLLMGDLRGLTIEVHAAAEYIDAIRGPLIAAGAGLVEPLEGLTHGQRLHWYDDQSEVPTVDPEPSSALPTVQELVGRLRESAIALTPAELIQRGPADLRVPGLYSWWVDAQGAQDLSAGLGGSIEPGLVYAGLAGATRWPSGKKSSNTLWSRITGMHLGKKHSFSTLRRTFGSVLAASHGWSEIDEVALTGWMQDHLRVVLVPYPDADDLGRVEEAVLSELNPPLNLRSVPSTDIRRALSALRSKHGTKQRSIRPVSR